MREALEFAELDGVHDGAAEVDGDNVEVAARQMGEIPDGLVRPFQDQTAFPAERPLCDLAFGRCRRDDCKKEEDRNELEHLLLFYKYRRR